MRTLKVGEIYNVTQISKNNSEAWQKLMEAARGLEGNVCFDFEGIQLMEPWNNKKFREFISNERVYLKIYCAENLKDNIEWLCAMYNIKRGRVQNVDIIRKIKPVVENEMEMYLRCKIKGAFQVKEDMVMLDMSEIVDQMGSLSTVKILRKAISEHSEETGIKKYRIDTKAIFIQQNIIEKLAELITEMNKVGMEVRILSEDKETANIMETYRILSGVTRISEKRKVKIIEQEMDKGAVGILIKYKDTRGKDAFGRKGAGIPIISRAAIYKGITYRDREPYIAFLEFHGSTFMTRMHYMLDHDMQPHPGLRTRNIVMPLKEVGFCDRFVGSLYHFNMPIQYDTEDGMPMYKRTTDGKITVVQRLLPEYIKAVLDDFDISYDRAQLMEAIGETYKYLSDRESNLCEGVR